MIVLIVFTFPSDFILIFFSNQILFVVFVRSCFFVVCCFVDPPLSLLTIRLLLVAPLLEIFLGLDPYLVLALLGLLSGVTLALFFFLVHQSIHYLVLLLSLRQSNPRKGKVFLKKSIQDQIFKQSIRTSSLTFFLSSLNSSRTYFWTYFWTFL